MIGAWNIGGANSHLKHAEFKKFVWENKLDYFGLLETRLRLDNINSFCSTLWQQFLFTHNATNGRKARIIVCWDPARVSFSEM